VAPQEDIEPHHVASVHWSSGRRLKAMSTARRRPSTRCGAWWCSGSRVPLCWRATH